MASFLLIWFITLLVGFAFVFAIWPYARSWRALLLRLALGVGPGVGIASVAFFLGRATGIDPPFIIYLGILTFLALLLLVIGAWRCSWKVGIERPGLPSGWGWLWLGALLLAFILAVNSLLGSVVRNPEGEWDAWAMWNMHARFLFQSGQDWLGMFDPALVANTHPDYPLLTPAMIGLSWRGLGRVSTLGPTSVALVFALATAGLIFTALNYQRKFIAACLAAMIILVSGPLLATAAILYADIPLAYMILGTVVTLYLFLREGELTWLVLSGTFCGLSTWTKNEGWSVLMATAAALAVVLWIDRRSKERSASLLAPDGVKRIARMLGYFLGGALFWILVTLYYKQAFTPPNDLFAARTLTDVLANLISLPRWSAISGRVISEISRYDGRIAVILALVALTIGFTKGKRIFLAAGWIVIGLVLVQYMGIFALTPHDLAWHLDVMPRLITQLYPAALFLFFNSLNLPGTQEQHA